MSEKVYDVPAEWQKSAYIDDAKYQEMYRRSIADPNAFWENEAKRIHWYRTPTKIKDVTYTGNLSIKWYEDGVPNVAYNCICRRLPTRANQVAIIWEGDDPKDD